MFAITCTSGLSDVERERKKQVISMCLAGKLLTFILAQTTL